MIRKEDHQEYPFSAAELREVCAEYAAALATSAEEVEPEFEPSAVHMRNIRALTRKSQQRTRRRAFWRSAVVTMTTFIVLFSMVMVTNVHARELTVQWLRSILPDQILYQFYNRPTGELYKYTIGWIPDGFMLTESAEEGDTPYYIYESDTQGIIIDFCRIGEWDNMSFFGYEEYVLTDTEINGMEAMIYEDVNSDYVDMMMVDHEKGMIITISTNIGLDQTLKIAESIF